jgi:glycosyltransferase involved in cell wall biosynthesis
MRILTALTYYRPHYSGLTMYAERLARALARRGHQVTVLTSRFSPELPAEESRDGVRVLRPWVWLRVSKGVLMPQMLVWGWREMRRVDVVHLHLPQLDAAPLSLLARALGKPVVLTYHCDLRLPAGWIHRLANWGSNLANRISAAAAQAIVTNSRDYAENSAFLSRTLSKIQPIYPPVELPEASADDRQDFRQRANIRPGERLIGMAARLASEKGVEYLAAAMPAVLERFPQARVLFMGQYRNVLGEEAYAQKLAPLIERLGGRWTFLGNLTPPELAAFYHECEVTVLPSLNSTESFGIVQVEAMSCGTPVVASDLPGVRQPVLLTGMGRIVPPADSRRLAEALITILDHPNGYHRQEVEILRQFTPQAVAEAYERLFTSLLKKPAG